MRRVAVLTSIVLALLMASGPVSYAQPPAAPMPTSMAAIGDSMTQAADACCWYGDHPANSWSTGDAGWDAVRSHYERVRAVNPEIAGRNFNDSVSGAKMRDGAGQAARAVDQRARYVTILLGANDLCTSSLEGMTSVEDFRIQFRQTLQTLDSGLSPKARIFVSSIPDVYQLWLLYQGDSTARWVWDTADICQSLLSPGRTDDERQVVRDRNLAFNQVLAEECALMSRCRFDGHAVFNYRFARADVSRLDYFHPSLSGQAHLADITWATSWWNS